MFYMSILFSKISSLILTHSFIVVNYIFENSGILRKFIPYIIGIGIEFKICPSMYGENRFSSLFVYFLRIMELNFRMKSVGIFK